MELDVKAIRRAVNMMKILSRKHQYGQDILIREDGAVFCLTHMQWE